jgi:hypothetical protein
MIAFYTLLTSLFMQKLQRWQKQVRKTEKFLNSSEFQDITLAKMNQSNQNANWNCNSLLQNNKPSFNAVDSKMATPKSPENPKKKYFGQTDSAIA